MSTSTLRILHSALNRSIKRAMAQNKVKRNVVELATLPKGREGRQSKSLTLAQAAAILETVEGTRMHAYVVVSLLTGARTEELRALLWSDVDLLGRPDLNPPVPPSMAVWRSVRATGDTKTKRSRRTLALPARCVDVLSEHSRLQARIRAEAGAKWVDLGLVFTTRYGTPLDSADVRRDFRAAIGRAAGVDADASGRPGSCGTRSCRSCPTAACRSRRSPASSGTAARWSRRSCTGSSSARSSSPARPSWIASSRLPRTSVAGRLAGRTPSGTDEPGSLAGGTGL